MLHAKPIEHSIRKNVGMQLLDGSSLLVSRMSTAARKERANMKRTIDEHRIIAARNWDEIVAVDPENGPRI